MIMRTLILSISLLGALGLAQAQHSAIVELPDSIAAAGATVKWVRKVPSYCEGPVSDAQGNLYFTEQKSGNDWPIWKINPSNPNDTGTIWGVPGFQSNGLTFDTQGRLIAAQKGRIARYLPDGKIDSVLVESGKGATFGNSNDLSLGSDGSMYFTDLGNQVFYADAKRKLSVAATGFSGANGVEFVPEAKAVYVFEVSKGQITLTDIQTNGTLTNSRLFASVPSPDGGDLDIHGNWYVGSYSQGTVFVLNAKGIQIGKITFMLTSSPYDTRAGAQGNICNCHFGGSGNKTLFCTGDGGAYSFDLKIPGRASLYSTPVNALIGAPRPPATKATSGFRLDGRGIPLKAWTTRAFQF